MDGSFLNNLTTDLCIVCGNYELATELDNRAVCRECRVKFDMIVGRYEDIIREALERKDKR